MPNYKFGNLVITNISLSFLNCYVCLFQQYYFVTVGVISKLLVANGWCMCHSENNSTVTRYSNLKPSNIL